ncbi:DUF7837 family putative zinc-binding protein [Halolamina pelagica]
MSITSLGSCPVCGNDIPTDLLLIEYETGVFAECPQCREPVHPE